jgi:anti-anti-sigma regulatory factor/anti-sigma regulatory factor (Ser/Thr protein kinase)
MHARVKPVRHICHPGSAATSRSPMVRLGSARSGTSSGEARLALSSGGFTVQIELAHPVAVVRASGVLDAYSAADLRTALLECVVDQPDGVVVDVADLAVTDDVALTVVGSVARQSELWPGTRFALAGASRPIEESVSRLGLERYVTLCPDQKAAVSSLSRGPAPASRRDYITPDRHAPGVARAAVDEFCTAHGVVGGDAAQLVASELVTNAVVHAGTPIELTLRLVPPLLHIAVRDGGDGYVKIPDIVDESSISGRGLLLVDAMATAWGSVIPERGKVVWATVRVRPSRPIE